MRRRRQDGRALEGIAVRAAPEDARRVGLRLVAVVVGLDERDEVEPAVAVEVRDVDLHAVAGRDRELVPAVGTHAVGAAREDAHAVEAGEDEVGVAVEVEVGDGVRVGLAAGVEVEAARWVEVARVARAARIDEDRELLPARGGAADRAVEDQLGPAVAVEVAAGRAHRAVDRQPRHALRRVGGGPCRRSRTRATRRRRSSRPRGRSRRAPAGRHRRGRRREARPRTARAATRRRSPARRRGGTGCRSHPRPAARGVRRRPRRRPRSRWRRPGTGSAGRPPRSSWNDPGTRRRGRSSRSAPGRRRRTGSPGGRRRRGRRGAPARRRGSAGGRARARSRPTSAAPRRPG